MLPNRIKLSKKATDKLRHIKGQTGLTPNILSRIAIMLAIKEGSNLLNACVNDNDGQEINDATLFGEYIYVYDVLINQYIHYNNISMGVTETIVALIEVGVHKMGHVKRLEQLGEIV